MVNIPVTRVILKDGSYATVRESVTTIKHCKRNNLGLQVVLDSDGEKMMVHAKNIKTILSSTL